MLTNSWDACSLGNGSDLHEEASMHHGAEHTHTHTHTHGILPGGQIYAVCISHFPYDDVVGGLLRYALVLVLIPGIDERSDESSGGAARRFETYISFLGEYASDS
eukprot:6206619-Pleurochrysis_carterae.AAC.2